MQTFPTLKTERLILNRPTESDLDDIVFYMNSTSQISENTLTIPFPYKEEDAKFWLKIIEEGFEKKDAFIFGIRKKENLKLIGGMGIHLDINNQKAEVGYWLGKDFWNNGYATEALKEVLKFGFEKLNLNKIYASHFPHNPASGKILEKCGMTKEAVLKQEVLKGEIFLDIVRYSCMKQDFS